MSPSSSVLRARARLALAKTIRGEGNRPEGTVDAAGNDLDPVELAQMRDALRRLAPRERAVLLAARRENLTDHQIAERLGLSVPEVERLFVQAFINLHRNLDHPWRCWWRRWWLSG